MNFTKIHAAGRDYLVCADKISFNREKCERLLDRHFGIGGEGIISVIKAEADNEFCICVLNSDGTEKVADACAAVVAAKFLFDCERTGKNTKIVIKDIEYNVRFTVLSKKVICAWVSLPQMFPRPMDRLKYCHGIRGEVLRECMPDSKLGLYTLCGERAVFIIESFVMLKNLNIRSVCKKMSDVLFWGERIKLDFAAICGENAISVRSWCKEKGETSVSAEDAAVAAYAFRAAELADSDRILVKSINGTYCVDLYDKNADICVKCETVFFGRTSVSK